MKEGTMRREFDKLFAGALAFLVIVLPGSLTAAERRGAEIIVSCVDGQTVSGELIAVKRDSLLLLLPTGKDKSVAIVDIASIAVIKKSNTGKGALFGFLVGVAVGGGLALAQAGGSQIGQEYLPLYAITYGLPAAFGGALIGSLIGSGTRSERTIVLSGLPEPTLRARLNELDRLARLRSPN